MQPYRNLAGDSGVVAYETGADFIRVRFAGGDTYLYTYRSAGARNIEHMKALAVEGRGLSTFISQSIRDRYEAKVRSA